MEWVVFFGGCVMIHLYRNFINSRFHQRKVTMFLQNLHTHSQYCDGADTPEELILAALEKGFSSIGFSGHSYMSYSPFFVQMGDKTQVYKEMVSELKERYRDQIEIYLGLEVDMYSGPDLTGYDYLIGAVHYLKLGEEYVGFDRREGEVETIINRHFGGDGMKYAKFYYQTLAQLPQYGSFDIIGHFDLITKHCDNRQFFDMTSKEYLCAAFEAADALSGKIPFFEVNTGAMARGYRNSPYPDIEILKYLKERGFGAVITSDCHAKNSLDYRFDMATELLKAAGFKEQYVLRASGFTAISL